MDIWKYVLDEREHLKGHDYGLSNAVDVKISFNIMVKDEERCIARCLDSIMPLADEVVIADTGSQDKTVEIISSFKSDKIKLFHYEWNDDFAAVRNFMLSKSSHNVIFQVDADEYIDDCAVDYGEIRKVILTLLGTHKDDIILSPFMKDITRCNYGKMKRIFYYSDDNFYYYGRVHEELRNRNKTLEAIQIDLPMLHDGYLDDILAQKNKNYRNISLMEHNLKEDGQNPRWLYFMARNMFFANYPIQDMLSYANKALDLLTDEDTHVYHRNVLNVIIAKAYLKNERYAEFEQALQNVDKKNAEYFYLQLLYLHEAGFDSISRKLVDVVTEFGKLKNPESVFNSNYDHIWTCLFWLYLQLFYFDEAKDMLGRLYYGKDNIRCKLMEFREQLEMIIEQC